MNMVRIVHPDGLESEVPESAVASWRASGWDVAPERETKLPTPPEGEASEKSKDKPRGSRRRSDEESE